MPTYSYPTIIERHSDHIIVCYHHRDAHHEVQNWLNAQPLIVPLYSRLIYQFHRICVHNADRVHGYFSSGGFPITDNRETVTHS
jgi:hypothetical protein